MACSMLELLTYFVCVFNLEFINSATINDTKVLIHDLVKENNPIIRPIFNQSEPINVNVELGVKYIQSLDEVNGIFTAFAGPSYRWNDAGMVWNPDDYGGIKKVWLPFESVWTLELILMNPAERTSSFGRQWNTVKYESNGDAAAVMIDIIKSTCDVNMRNYPFDSQICNMTFMSWGYTTDYVQMINPDGQAFLEYYEENNFWTLQETHADVVNNTISFAFKIRRKPEFIMINVVLPLALLGILNAFVFLLAEESGERISYCITILLSISVFMTIVSDTLPKSSKPVPVISYKLLFDLVVSSLIILFTIFNMRIHHKTTRVPRWLQNMYECLTCKNTIPKKCNKVDFNNDQTAYTDAVGEDNGGRKERLNIQEQKNQDNVRKNETQVSWMEISGMLDLFAFVVFMLTSLFSFSVFLITVQ